MSKISLFCVFVLCVTVKEILAFTPVKNCGVSNVSSLVDRIVGGREAIPGEFPWLVDKIIIHKKFVFETFLNDIALVRVTQPIPLSKKINAICLPQPTKIASGIATAAGWGATSEDGASSTVLMAVNLPIVPQPICEDLFGPEFYSTSAMICAGYPEGGRDTCQGDSGGPLIQRINGSFTVIGIVSFGVGCARPQLPGVYTKVTNYISWISTNAK